MKNVIIAEKRIGETPLECLDRIRNEYSISKGIPMTYAGRLDPMAGGLLIILIGEECKNKEKYLNLDKEYIVEVLIGIETDSLDLLGIIEKVNTEIFDIQIEKYIGKMKQEYPRYSSKVIAMKELPDEMPVKDIEIYNIEKIDERFLNSRDIYEYAIKNISLIKGDFRQKEIIEKWNDFLTKYSNNNFKIITIKVLCSSGTYMRSLAHNMGGIAFSILRTKIGEYNVLK